MIFLLSGVLMIGEYIWRHFYFQSIKMELPDKPIPGVMDVQPRKALCLDAKFYQKNSSNSAV
jgi:hypothetical protein